MDLESTSSAREILRGSAPLGVEIQQAEIPPSRYEVIYIFDL